MVIEELGGLMDAKIATTDAEMPDARVAQQLATQLDSKNETEVLDALEVLKSAIHQSRDGFNYCMKFSGPLYEFTDRLISFSKVEADARIINSVSAVLSEYVNKGWTGLDGHADCMHIKP
jgi:hypothetical protein